MADDELEKLLAEPEKETPAPASEKAPEPTQEEKNVDEELEKKRLQLENLNKAVLEANASLKKTRKEAKNRPLVPQESEEDELPQIDMADPSAKAWDKHIRESVSPLQEEVERQKEEVRSDALRIFLADKPELASNPDKLKRLVGTYERLKQTSERSVEGVMMDLDASYAAQNHRELTEQARYKRISEARANEQFSEAGVSRGATAYSQDRQTKKQVSPEIQKITDRWDETLKGMGIDMSK